MVFSCILLVSASAETPLEKVKPYLAAKESVHEQRMDQIGAKVNIAGRWFVPVREANAFLERNEI